MEAVGLPSLHSLTTTSCFCFQSSKLFGRFNDFNSIKLTPNLAANHKFNGRRVMKVQASYDGGGGDDDYDLKKMRDMAAAKRRWDLLIREGKVKVLTPREAGYAAQLSGKTMLDVRPSVERNKAWVKGSTWLPIFEVDDRFDIGTLASKITTFAMGGWWSGMPTLAYDKQFLLKAEEKFPKDTDLIVACQRGLRSLAACELLYNAGYRNLFWVQGGLEAAEEEDLVTEGSQPLKFAGIGGLSEFLGWTDQQRVVAAKEGWGYRLVFSARLVGVILVADALFLGAQQVSRYIQELRIH